MKRDRGVGTGVALYATLIASLAGSAGAQGVIPAPVVTPLPPSRPRLRFSIGGEGGVLVEPTPQLSGGGLGFYLVLGAQLTEHFSLAVTGAFSTSIITLYANAGAQLEVHPIDLFSLSLGVAYTRVAAFSPFGFGNFDAQGVTVPLGVHLNLGRRQPSGARRGFHLGAFGELFLGEGRSSSTFWGTSGGSAGLTAGGGFRLQAGYTFY